MGNYTAEQQAPDADLGRSIRPGWRNVSDDPERSFGALESQLLPRLASPRLASV